MEWLFSNKNHIRWRPRQNLSLQVEDFRVSGVAVFHNPRVDITT
jgi:hypothetical protein